MKLKKITMRSAKSYTQILDRAREKKEAKANQKDEINYLFNIQSNL